MTLLQQLRMILIPIILIPYQEKIPRTTSKTIQSIFMITPGRKSIGKVKESMKVLWMITFTFFSQAITFSGSYTCPKKREFLNVRRSARFLVALPLKPSHTNFQSDSSTFTDLAKRFFSFRIYELFVRNR